MKAVITLAMLCSTIYAADEYHSSITDQVRAASMAGISYASEQQIPTNRLRSSTAGSNENSPIQQRKMASAPLLSVSEENIVSITIVSNEITSYLEGAFYINHTTSGSHVMWNQAGATKQAHLFRKYASLKSSAKTPNKILRSEAKWFAKKHKLLSAKYRVASNAIDKNWNEKRAKERKKKLIPVKKIGHKSYFKQEYINRVDALITARGAVYRALVPLLECQSLNKLDFVFVDNLNNVTKELNERIEHLINSFGQPAITKARDLGELASELKGFKPIYIKNSKALEAKKLEKSLELAGIKLEVYSSGETRLSFTKDDIQQFRNKRLLPYAKIKPSLKFADISQQVGEVCKASTWFRDDFLLNHYNSKQINFSELLKTEFTALNTFDYKIYYLLCRFLKDEKRFMNNASEQAELCKSLQQFDTKLKRVKKLMGIK